MRAAGKTSVNLHKYTKTTRQFTVLSLWNSLLQRVYGHITFYHKYGFNRYLVEFWKGYETLPPLLWSICVTVPFVW